jgi:tetratricopeptide (TPR) repeat protein
MNPMDNESFDEHPIVTKARAEKERSLKLRDEGRFAEAVDLLKGMIALIEQTLAEFKGASPRAPAPSEIEVADQALHLNGTLGGIFRRWEKLDDALKAYAKGAEIERDPRYSLPQSYTSTQHAVLRCLVEPGLIVRAAQESDSGIHQDLTELYRRIVRQMRGPRRGDVYAAADRAIVSLLLGQQEWEEDLISFLTLAKQREEDYAERVTVEVIRMLAAEVQRLDTARSNMLSHWAEALSFLP